MLQANEKSWDTPRSSFDRLFLASSPTDFSSSARVATPAVVSIQATQVIDYNIWSGQSTGQSSGSGVIISPEGYIATNNHVIEDATTINITLDDRREFKAELIGTDPTTDLALLKIKSADLPYLEFGNSDSLLIGEWVLSTLR